MAYNVVNESAITDKFSPSIHEMVVGCLHPISYGKFTVKEVIKAGSLGKGTATLDSDIDLVVYFNGVDNIQEMRREKPRLKKLIEDAIKSSPNYGRRLRLTDRQEPNAVRCRADGIEMDILPAFDIVAKLGSLAEVYKEIADSEDVKKSAYEYSVLLTKVQRDFFKHLDSRIKEAVKDMKKWSEENKLKIPSYALELVAASMYIEDMSRGVLYRKCMEQLANCDKLKIAFKTDNYNCEKYTKYMSKPYYIMDPANPFNNVLERVDVDRVSSAAFLCLRTL